jgi:hypothetical protein
MEKVLAVAVEAIHPNNLYKLALASLAGGDRSIGIVR